jgi:hypothetical protein
MLELQLSILAISFCVVMLLSAVFAISGNRAVGGWGWSTLLVFTGLGLLTVAAMI